MVSANGSLIYVVPITLNANFLLLIDWNQDFLHQDDYLDSLPSENSGGKAKIDTDSLPPLHWARIEFQTPVYCPMDSLVIGSRLDTEVNANACRLAFSGRLVARYDAKTVGFLSVIVFLVAYELYKTTLTNNLFNQFRTTND